MLLLIQGRGGRGSLSDNLRSVNDGRSVVGLVVLLVDGGGRGGDRVLLVVSVSVDLRSLERRRIWRGLSERGGNLSLRLDGEGRELDAHRGRSLLDDRSRWLEGLLGRRSGRESLEGRGRRRGRRLEGRRRKGRRRKKRGLFLGGGSLDERKGWRLRDGGRSEGWLRRLLHVV